MVWYLNSSGDGIGNGDVDAAEVIEHVFHTIHMSGLDAIALKQYSEFSSDWASGPTYAAMQEAYDGGLWDSEGYGGDAWKSDPFMFEVARKNICTCLTSVCLNTQVYGKMDHFLPNGATVYGHHQVFLQIIHWAMSCLTHI